MAEGEVVVDGDTISLLLTPTYALALVALVFIMLSFFISFGLNALARVSTWNLHSGPLS